MPDDLLSMEMDFKDLANRLGALIDLCSNEPTLFDYANGLRAARHKASRGAELIRNYRERQP